MKRALCLAALLLAVLAAWGAAAEGVDRFLGGWVNDEYRMYILLEDEEVSSRLTQTEGDCVWEFDRCWYSEEDGRLYGPNYVRYRQTIDWETMELVQEDWALGDLGFTYFELADGGDTLIAVDVPNLDGTLTFRRVSDGEYSGS